MQATLTNTAERTDLGDSPITAEEVELPEVVAEPEEVQGEEEENTGPHQTGELEEVAVVVVVLEQAREE